MFYVFFVNVAIFRQVYNQIIRHFFKNKIKVQISDFVPIYLFYILAIHTNKYGNRFDSTIDFS